MTATAILPPVAQNIHSKRCPCCGQTLASSNFHKNGRSQDGLQGFCIECAKKSRKKPNKTAVDQTRALKSFVYESGSKPCSTCLVCKTLTDENWKSENRGLGGYSSKCKACDKQARLDKKAPELIAKQDDALRLNVLGMKRCPCCKDAKPHVSFIKRKRGGYYSYCLECCKNQSNEKRLVDVEGDREKKLRSWRKRIVENGDAMRAARNVHRNGKRKIDVLFALECRIRSNLGQSFRRLGYTKRSRTYTILGCDWEFFRAHIERQFLKGMNWENRDGWHIDHITPTSTAETEADLIALNHFTNLRPMWAKDNLSKGAQITHLI